MKVESKHVGPCRVRLVVKAEAEETRADFDEILGAYLKASRIPGFRAGKAPLPAVEQHYRREIDVDVRTRLASKFSRLAIEESKLAVVAAVGLTDIILSPATGISFVLLVDVAPDVKLPKYHKIPIRAEPATVTDDDVAGQVGHLRNAVAQFADTDTAVEEGDLARVDYTATCKGKPLQELAGDCGNLGAASGQWVQAAEPEFLPGLALALRGMKAGDRRTVEVRFPRDFHVEAVRGLTAAYDVSVGGVRRRSLPDDAELCKRLNMESMETMRARVRRDAEAAAAAREQSRRQQEVLDYLLRKTEFVLPQSQVAAETEQVALNVLRNILQRGGSRDDIEKNRESILVNAAASSKDRLRARYILARIAEEEKVQVTADEEDAYIADVARRHRVTPEAARAEIEKNHSQETLRADIRAEKTLEWLVADAKLS